MSTARIEVFRDENYLVLSHGPMVHPCTIIAFSQRGDSDHPLVPGGFNRQFLPDRVSDWGIKANFMSFITSRNCWYLTPEVDPAIAAINAVTGHKRVITYDSSMGGYAAINLSSALKSDYFFALSPISTIFNPFMTQIRDFRFGPEREHLPNARDGIARGDSIGRRGLIIFDDMCEPDTHHARVILSKTMAQAITVSYSDHPSGPTFNRIFPLNKVLAAIVDGSLDVGAIQAEVDRIVPDLPQTLAGKIETFDRFLDMVDHSPQLLVKESFTSAIRTLAKPANAQHITKPMIAKVAAAALRAVGSTFGYPVFTQIVWQLCLAYENIGCFEDSAAFACDHLTGNDKVAFFARKSLTS